MKAIEELAREVGTARACEALAVPRASYYRQRSAKAVAHRGRPRQRAPRALSNQERQQVLDVLHSERFIDKAPCEVYATLLDEGSYLCSVRTMYRILGQTDEVRERRNQLRHPQYKKPELLATAPNQVWSWDITKLLGPQKWTYFYLYVILDIFSRYVVGWMLASRESAQLAQRLIRETLQKQNVNHNELTIHSDRGAAMKSHSVAQLLATLGVTKSHSRPHVSNDNPFSESQFKTLKYRPEFPDRFGSQEHALQFLRPFFQWYNYQHYHSGIGLLTPAMVHYGHAQQIIGSRQQLLEAAYAAHPERFVNKHPTPPEVPTEVWINPPQTDMANEKPNPQENRCEPQTGRSGEESEFQNWPLTSAEQPTRLITPADSGPYCSSIATTQPSKQTARYTKFSMQVSQTY